MKTPIYLIVAVDKALGMGKAGKLPWHFKKEMRYFQEKTENTQDPTKINMVIMGRNTWESIPESHRPLPGRKNVILSRNKAYQAEGAHVVDTFTRALKLIDDSIETVYVIGGAKVFAETLKNKKTTGIYLTRIHETFDCDTFFPDYKKPFKKETHLGLDEENGVKWDYLLLER